MQRPRITIAALLAAALLLAGAASSAHAVTIGPSGTQTATGSLLFVSRSIAIRCTTRLDRTIVAGTYAFGSQIGTLDAATLAPCSSAAQLVGLPSPIVAASLNGLLLREQAAIGLLATIAGSNCLWRGQLLFDTDGATARVVGSTLTLDPTAPLSMPFCSALGNLTPSGTFTLSPGYGISLP